MRFSIRFTFALKEGCEMKRAAAALEKLFSYSNTTCEGMQSAGRARAVFSALAERRDTHAGYVKLIWTKL